MNPLDPNDPLKGRKLQLDFPCAWTYTVIGERERDLYEAMRVVVGEHEHTIQFSHESRGGRYRSYQLEVTVPSDEERLRIFRELHAHVHVRYIF